MLPHSYFVQPVAFSCVMTARALGVFVKVKFKSLVCEEVSYGTSYWPEHVYRRNLLVYLLTLCFKSRCYTGKYIRNV